MKFSARKCKIPGIGEKGEKEKGEGCRFHMAYNEEGGRRKKQLLGWG